MVAKCDVLKGKVDKNKNVVIIFAPSFSSFN